MGNLQTICVWAALSGAVFSFPLAAQETVTKGNEKNPYQPPVWIAHLLQPSPDVWGVHYESWKVPRNDFSGWIGRPSNATPKKACKKMNDLGVLVWAFCEL